MSCHHSDRMSHRSNIISYDSSDDILVVIQSKCPDTGWLNIQKLGAIYLSWQMVILGAPGGANKWSLQGFVVQTWIAWVKRLINFFVMSWQGWKGFCEVNAYMWKGVRLFREVFKKLFRFFNSIFLHSSRSRTWTCWIQNWCWSNSKRSTSEKESSGSMCNISTTSPFAN